VSATVALSADVLALDAERESARITAAIRRDVVGTLRRRGAVVGLSGGIDSSVVAALCARALGPRRVLGLLMPEADSSPDSLRLGRLVARTLGIDTALEDIAPVLAAAGCYRRRDEAIRTVVPGYGEGWQSKLVLSDTVGTDRYAVFSVVVRAPDGEEQRARLTAEAYLGVVAATSFKQRVRKMMEYYHADRRQYAVAGTPNRLEYEQGFFVKNGDGAADLKPLAHLYKGQVYQLGRHLGIPEEIERRVPTTDTYSSPQSQEEFYFALRLDKMDLCLYGVNHGVPAAEVAAATGLTVERVEQAYRFIEGQRNAARYLHRQPLLVEDLSEGPYPGRPACLAGGAV
jgi:NAD+ synthase